MSERILLPDLRAPRHDLRHMTCGLVPHLRQLLDNAGSWPVEALVPAKAVAAIVESLSLLFAVDVEARGDEALLRFRDDSRTPVDDPLNRV